MIIRQVNPNDHEQWLPLWDGYNAFYGRAGQTALDPKVTAVTWARLLDPDQPVHGLIAEEDGVLTGLAHYIFHRSTIMSEDTCYMQDLFTTPEGRGRGIGRALIEAVYARARDAGCTRVYWHTREDNAQARRLYDAVAVNSGFIVYRKTF
ncbi:MAG: N-acetyltransferase family protein [Asticcacaulis sp.]